MNEEVEEEVIIKLIKCGVWYLPAVNCGSGRQKYLNKIHENIPFEATESA